MSKIGTSKQTNTTTQDQPKLLTALKGIYFRKQIFGRYISVLLNCLNYI
jgi:hypothetical protein